MCEQDYTKYLAKSSGELLTAHSLSVSDLAEKLSIQLPFSDEFRKKIAEILSELGMLHDIGKTAAGFQKMLKEKENWPHRHEILSTFIAAQIAPYLKAEELMPIISHHRSIPEAIGSSAGEKCLPDNELPFIRPNAFDELISEISVEKKSILELLAALNKEKNLKWQLNAFDFSKKNLGVLEQYWLRRQSIGQKANTTSQQRYYASFLRGLLISADHLASAHHFQIPDIPKQIEYIDKIKEMELRGNPILPFQVRCAGKSGDAILKAPTGSGKTAAILLWAAKNQVENGRLFYVLPHTASINAMYRRLQKIYGDDKIGVLHHKNAAFLYKLFEEDASIDDPETAAKSAASLARELYHPIRVSTPHQILRFALQGKGWELGLAEFPGACFVFDEIHAFEPLLIGLTIATIRLLKRMGASVLFASATLPEFLEKILCKELEIDEDNVISPDPDFTGDREVLGKIRHRIKVRSGSLVANLESIQSEIEESKKTVLIICNHVATSQAVWAKLKDKFDCRLLHAKFNADDRFRIEGEIQSANPPRVLIATQAVEVSLDLDYDCGYIEPAPADALGQRLGRINRKGSRLDPADVVIFEQPSLANKNGDPLFMPYDENTVNKTVELLKTVEQLTEAQLTAIVNKIYQNGYTDSSLTEYEKGLNNSLINNFENEIIAGTHKSWVESVIEGTDGQLEVLPMSYYDEFREKVKSKKYTEARMLLVPLQTRQYHMLIARNVLHFDDIIDEYVTNLEYCPDSGLDLSGNVENIF
ncbi:MAG: CRISPR-associated helicase Cas3' [Candidatus Wallbacteria bacterium]|nr:CRISPR-associated helicase Cas3' [Candidatus Wallbacteria bacterium]